MGSINDDDEGVTATRHPVQAWRRDGVARVSLPNSVACWQRVAAWRRGGDDVIPSTPSPSQASACFWLFTHKNIPTASVRRERARKWKIRSKSVTASASGSTIFRHL